MNLLTELSHWTSDPIIWMRLLTSLMFLSAGVMLFIDRIVCVGTNPKFHKMIGSVFLALSYFNVDLAISRAQSMTNGTPVISVEQVFLSTIVVTIASIVIATKLGVDYFRYDTYRKYDIGKSPCDECQARTKVATQ